MHQYNDNSEEDAIMSDAMEHLLEETPAANLYNQHHQMQAPAETIVPQQQQPSGDQSLQTVHEALSALSHSLVQ